MGVADHRIPTCKVHVHCKPGDGVLDCKGLYQLVTIAPNTLAKVNKEVKLSATGQKKK